MPDLSLDSILAALQAGQQPGLGGGTPQQEASVPSPVSMPPSPPQAPPPVAPTPSVSPADQFEQDTMQRLRDNTTENLEKKKMDEYLNDLGIAKNPNSLKARLLRAGSEAGRYYSAQQAKTPYQTKEQEIRDSAQKEYEKTYPLIRAEAESVFKNQRERNKEASAANVQGLKNIPLMARVQMQQDLGNKKDEIARDLALHEKGNKDATARLKNGQAKLLEMGMQQYPELVGLPKDQQSLLAPMIITSLLGQEGSARYFRAIQDQKNAAQPPKDTASSFDAQDAEKKQSLLDTFNAMEKMRGQAKPAMAPSFTQVKQMVWNPDTQQMEEKSSWANPKNPTAPMIPMTGGEPVQQNRIKQNAEWNDTIGQARTFASTVASAIKDGSIDHFTGPAEGNPLVRALRAMGWEPGPDGVGTSPREAMIKAFRSNTLFKHTKALLSSSRMSTQALDHVSDNVSKLSDDPNSLMTGAMSILHSAEQGRMMSGDPTLLNKITPGLESHINNRLKQYMDSLKVKDGLPAGDLPSYVKLFNEYQTAVPSGGASTKPKTRMELFNEKYGAGAQ